MTRKAAVLGLGYLAGLLMASFFAIWLSCAAGVLLLCFGAVMIFIIRPDKSGRLFAFSAAALCCGIGMLYYSGYDAFVYRDTVSRSRDFFEGTAEIKDVKIFSEDSAFCTARVTLSDGKTADIGWYAHESVMARGDGAFISGTLYTPENTSFFNSADYYRSQNIFLLLDTDKEEYFPRDKSIFHRLRNFRENAADIIRRYVPSDEGELLIGMIFGNEGWRMSSRTERALYRSGTGHIASVSGMHMAVAAGMVSALAAALSLSKRSRFILIALVCGVFALTADLGISVMRAFIMTILVFFGDMLRRQSDPLSSLCIAAIFLTAGTPFIVRSASFMLSFSGVLGAAVISPWLTEMVRKAYESKYDRKMGGAWLLCALSAAVCTSAAVIPASAICLDEFSVIAPLSNLLLSPLFSAAMMIALAGTMCSLLPFSWLSGGLFLAAGALCRPVLWAADKFGSLPFAVIPSGTKIAAPVIGLTVISAGIAALLMKNRSAVILTVSAAVFAGAVSITVYRAVPAGYTKISLLTEGNGSALIISDGKYAEIFDFMGSSKSVRAAERYIARNDAGMVGMVFAAERADHAAPLYAAVFPEAQIVSAGGNIGLTYEAGKDIIKFGEVCCYPNEDYFIIEAEGTEIICIDRKCSPPERHFDMCIYNCRADVFADADFYAVANKRYKGSVPVGSEVYTNGAEFAAKDGALFAGEERKWLR